MLVRTSHWILTPICYQTRENLTSPPSAPRVLLCFYKKRNSIVFHCTSGRTIYSFVHNIKNLLCLECSTSCINQCRINKVQCYHQVKCKVIPKLFPPHFMGAMHSHRIHAFKQIRDGVTSKQHQPLWFRSH